MNTQDWWSRFARTRLQLDVLLQACAPALAARSVHDEAGAGRDADRLSIALANSARVAQDVLRRSSQ